MLPAHDTLAGLLGPAGVAALGLEAADGGAMCLPDKAGWGPVFVAAFTKAAPINLQVGMGPCSISFHVRPPTCGAKQAVQPSSQQAACSADLRMWRFSYQVRALGTPAPKAQLCFACALCMSAGAEAARG